MIRAAALTLRAAFGSLSCSARLVLILGIRPAVVAFALRQLGAVFLEGVGDVFEEDEPEDDVLVFRRVHVVAELVRGEPELGFKAEVGGGVFGGRFP